MDSAEGMKYIKAIRNEFEKELNEPSEDFVKLLVNRFFDKRITDSRLTIFKDYAKKAFVNSINDSINFRLKNALNINETTPAKTEQNPNAIDEHVNQPKFITTEEEIEGSQIVKAILREKLPSTRIAFRDTQSYFGILMDDNNRKPICRLHFNSTNKYIELFSKGKDNGEKKLLNSLDEIYNYKSELLETVAQYD